MSPSQPLQLTLRTLVFHTPYPSFSAKARSSFCLPLLPEPWMPSSAFTHSLPHSSRGAGWKIPWSPCSRLQQDRWPPCFSTLICHLRVLVIVPFIGCLHSASQGTVSSAIISVGAEKDDVWMQRGGSDLCRELELPDQGPLLGSGHLRCWQWCLPPAMF